MKTYQQLKEEFDSKVMELQSKCKHKKLTEWLEQCWAIGHSTGKDVKICKFCNKIVKSRKSKELTKKQIERWRRNELQLH